MATKDTLRIGLALSGGGVRATSFHLGVLARLAQDGLLERVTMVSSVSGGSLAAGLLFTFHGRGWPSSASYLSTVLPKIRQHLTSTSLERAYTRQILSRPWSVVRPRAGLIAACLRRGWRMTGSLRDLPHEPRWIINATTFETGKRWGFSRERMGDYTLGYVAQPDFPIAEAVAASAGFPFAIGALALRPAAYRWGRFDGGRGDWSNRELTPTTPPPYRRLHLWDGGVYDNLGVEALMRGKWLRPEVSFLVVSDASGPLQLPWHQRYIGRRRLIAIALDQVRGQRSRLLVDAFERHPGSGVYLRISNSAEYLSQDGGAGATERAIVAASLPAEDAAAAALEQTRLWRLDAQVFDRLCRHGWEVADGTLRRYHAGWFAHQPWTCPWTTLTDSR